LVDTGYWVYRVRFHRDLRITFLDVGQANAALVEFPGGKKMLVDGGGFQKDHFDVGRMVITPFLLHSKIRRVEYLVLSHPQSDHMNGLRSVAKVFGPKEFWHNGCSADQEAYRDLMGILSSQGIPALSPEELSGGRTISGVEVHILHPDAQARPCPQSNSGKGMNNRSLVMRLTYRGQSILFPGDIEKEVESRFASDTGKALRSDVLLCPHHGSKTSSSREFLERVRPRVCVISCGEGNPFGFPHSQTMERLKEMDCRILRTDRSGTVQCTVDKDGTKVTTYCSP
jgi:competence protein ComEC